jgi:hypothetical protein
MKVTTTRAALAALLFAASSIALGDVAMAQSNRDAAESSDGIRAGRPNSGQRQAPTPTGAQLSAAVGKQLSAALANMTAKKWAEAMPQAKAAMTEAKTDYEKMKVNQFLTQIYLNTGDEANAALAAEAAADTPADAIPAEDKQTIYYTAAALANNAKHNDKALAYAKQLIALNPTDANSRNVITQVMYNSAPPAEAVAFFQKEIDTAIAAGRKPPRDVLDMKLNSQIKAKDNAGAERTLEEALAIYNDPKDWEQMYNVAISTPGIRDIDAVMVGRLNFASGNPVSKDNADLVGQTAQKLALYGDAQTAASKGGTGFTPDAKRIADDKATIPAQIAEGQKQNGIYNVKLAEALYGYGMYPQAETAARLALTKGGIDNSEAQMLIGMSLYHQGKYAEAQAAFAQVQGGSPATARIARLWSIQSKLKVAPATTAAATP